MAVKTKAELKAQATEIRVETIKDANTATRIGTHLEDVVDSMAASVDITGVALSAFTSYTASTQVNINSKLDRYIFANYSGTTVSLNVFNAFSGTVSNQLTQKVNTSHFNTYTATTQAVHNDIYVKIAALSAATYDDSIKEFFLDLSDTSEINLVALADFDVIHLLSVSSPTQVYTITGGTLNKAYTFVPASNVMVYIAPSELLLLEGELPVELDGAYGDFITMVRRGNSYYQTAIGNYGPYTAITGLTGSSAGGTSGSGGGYLVNSPYSYAAWSGDTTSGATRSALAAKFNSLDAAAGTMHDIQFKGPDGRFDAYSGFTYNRDIWALTMGDLNIASGEFSVAMGVGNLSSGDVALATGSGNIASGVNSVAMGGGTVASGYAAYAQGFQTIASGDTSHAAGYLTRATGSGAHATGYDSRATGDYSYTEGLSTLAAGANSHAEGMETKAIGYGSHAEGWAAEAVGQYSHAEGSGTRATGSTSHAEGDTAKAFGYASHAEGSGTMALSNASHAEGVGSIAAGNYCHAEGQDTIAIGFAGHAEGYATNAIGSYSHAEGELSISLGIGSHAEGNSTLAAGLYSHAEGTSTKASGDTAHAEGFNTRALGGSSHAQGSYTLAIGNNAHAGGDNTIAAGDNSIATGAFTIALGIASFNHSNSDVGQTAHHGALADYSAILGGQNANIPADATGSVVLGGYGIKVPSGRTNEVFVPALAIVDTPIEGNSSMSTLLWDADTKAVRAMPNLINFGNTITGSTSIVETDLAKTIRCTVAATVTLPNSFAIGHWQQFYNTSASADITFVASGTLANGSVNKLKPGRSAMLFVESSNTWRGMGLDA